MIKASHNQLANGKNPYQTKALKVLCVCSAGLLRSPTTANVLHKKLGFNTRSAGSSEAFALIPVTEALLDWAEEVLFVNKDNLKEMDAEQLEILEGKTVRVLNIPDQFNWGNPELEEIILTQYNNSEENKHE